jgi:hypothetical protein
MPDHTALEIEVLRAAYAAFNARDIDTALAALAHRLIQAMEVGPLPLSTPKA